MTWSLSDPPVLIIIGMLITAVTAFFMNHVHSAKQCREDHIRELADKDKRIAELKEDVDEYKELLRRLAGANYEAISILRKKS